MTDALTSLIEQHKKEIWQWKQKESQWLEDRVLLEGNKQIIKELSTKLITMKKRAQEAEGENTIIKGIGNNSPEMKALKAKVNELQGTLGSAQDINDNHQRYNGKLQTRITELEEDNKKLSEQITDYIKKHHDSIRRAGM